jgi:hypothetical protein
MTECLVQGSTVRLWAAYCQGKLSRYIEEALTGTLKLEGNGSDVLIGLQNCALIR